MAIPNLKEHPGKKFAIKRPIPVEVEFAIEDGVCATPEGLVHYKAGDAVAEGNHDDQWPIQRHKFLSNYEPVPPTVAGEPGQYVKKTLKVMVLQLSESIEVPVGWQDDPLHAKPGDWLVQYGPDDYGVIQPHIFEETYEIINEN